ncbi:hypothetical protein ACWEKT_41150, partial [Nocardia takedensis]
TCPSCGRLDWVQSVPALCSDGMSVSRGAGSYSGFGLSSSVLVPVFGTVTVDRTRTTALASSLAREPDWKPTGRLTRVGWILLLPAFLVLIAAAGATLSEQSVQTQIQVGVAGAIMVGVCASPGLLVLAAASSRRRHNYRILFGRPVAQTVWGAGFYCHRCGAAYWPHSPLAGIPQRQALSPQQFRWHVWQAARYNDTK